MGIATRYATAFLEVASEEDMDSLQEVNKILEEKNLLRYLSLSVFPLPQREEVLFSLCPQIGEKTRLFLTLLLRKRRINLLPEIVEELHRLKMQREGLALAKVTSPLPLREEEKKRLSEILERRWGKRVILQEQVDPSILGGLIVEIEGDMLDGSLKGFLQNLQNSLLEVSRR